jgi:TPR repeat protein
MLKIVLLIMAVLLSACEKADFETAHREFKAGNYDDALSQLKILAENGDAKAQNNLGYMYLKGIGVEINHRKAFNWYRKAAMQDVAEAQHSLGYIYTEGLGTEAVPALALKWYRLAAEQGLAEAQFNLAYMYENNIGIRRNNREVLFWYEQAAHQGSLAAQHKLGSMYLEGNGVEQDLLKAYAWFGVAVAGGHEQALSAREAIAVQFDFDQLEQARAMAREIWVKSGLKDMRENEYEGVSP